MVSESNFILGIKQTSLVSKEDSHVHITDRSHTCLSTGSRLHSISQPPWLTVVSRSSNQASRDLTYQICANPSFAWRNQNHRHAPRPFATKTQKSGHPKPCHAPPHASVVSRMSPRTVKNLETQLDHSHTRHHVGLTARWSAKPEKSGRLLCSHAPTRAAYVARSFPCTATISSCVAHPLATRAVLSPMSTTNLPTEEMWLSTNVARAFMRHLDFWLLLHVPVNITHPCHMLKHCCWCHLTSPDDVITPCQQPRKHVHVDPSPRQRHIIRMSQRLCSLIRDRPGNPEPTRTMYSLTLTLD